MLFVLPICRICVDNYPNLQESFLWCLYLKYLDKNISQMDAPKSLLLRLKNLFLKSSFGVSVNLEQNVAIDG
jgi:hypothetical protein